jgi:hypothetical protein
MRRGDRGVPDTHPRKMVGRAATQRIVMIAFRTI